MLQNMFQDMTSRMTRHAGVKDDITPIGKDMQRLKREADTMGNAINIVRSKFDIYTNLLDMDHKKLGCMVESQIRGRSNS